MRFRYLRIAFSATCPIACVLPLLRIIFSRWHFLVISAYCLQLVTATCDGSDQATADNARKFWDYNTEAVKTAELRYRHVYRNAVPSREPDAVTHLINSVNLVGNEAAQKKLITSLDTTLAGQKDVWSSNVFTLSGKNIRIDSTYQSHTTAHVLVGDIELESRTITPTGIHQTDVYPRGTSHIHMDSLSELCGRPKYSPPEAVFKFGTTALDNETVLPAVIVRAEYTKGKLKTFSMTMIDKAVFDKPIPDDAFTILGKPDDILLDMRRKTRDVIKLDRPFQNVLDALTPGTPPVP